MILKNRKDAAIKLSDALIDYLDEDAVIFALPRGGVVVGAEVARQLGKPLDIIITKKIGHPINHDYAVCAIAEDGEPICNETDTYKIDSSWFDDEVKRAREVIKRRREKYLLGGDQSSVEGKTAILIDDGVATGLTMMAAIAEVRKQRPKKVVVAVPVISSDIAVKIKGLVDDLIALNIDDNFKGTVGAYYDDFIQVTDDEVIDLL